MDLRIGYKSDRLAELVNRVTHVGPARSEMHGYDDSVALDRVKAVTKVGRRAVYGLAAEPSGLIVVNGIITGSVSGAA
ncbi:hypothetical protein [Streptomyces sp. AC555_RSS877]|uniref:hypothetical protein n=1 Tax=Streptomyces sp. AC555_RSS877 TaxID=2823688 RepID=UPI001C26B61B|nr:hypothetical protein [Streptomyces sp. AC555_RSS877]